MARRRSRRAPRLRRGRGHKTLRTLHIVFCEGKTEAACLRSLLRHHRVPAVEVRLEDQCGVPRTLVDRACREKARYRKAEQPRIHVVFDRDEHPRFDEAIRKAEDNGLTLGVSVPCFELWGVLLHEDHTAPIHRRDIQRRLRDLDAGYHHEKNPRLSPDHIVNGRADARARSEVLRRRAEEAERRWNNPVTTFDQVLDRILPPT